MKIGVPKEIKDKENRVALTPAGARALGEAGHEVLVQAGAGLGSGFLDTEYLAAGARSVGVEEAWDAELVLKVKEPLESEYGYLKDQILFTYLHLAGAPRGLAEALLAKRTSALAYETLEDARGRLPLLAPMSAVAGNMAVTVGSYYLARFNGGRGTQLGSVLGTRHGKVVVIGDGVVGRHAARTAAAMGAHTYIGGHEERLPEIRREISDGVDFFLSSAENIAMHLTDADLVVGAVLVPGARAPRVITEEMVKGMPRGSVIVDVSIDQGGCIETSRPTSHSAPVFERHGVIHYCVTNMPGAYPRTSTLALNSATLPYVLRLADGGLSALRGDTGFAKALNTYQGYITCRPVAEALGLEDRYRPLKLEGSAVPTMNRRSRPYGTGYILDARDAHRAGTTMQHVIRIGSHEREELIDLTAEVAAFVEKSGVKRGLVSVYAQGSTAAVMIQENWDESVQRDVVDLLRKLIPKGVWLHDAQDGNGDAHLKSGIVGPSETIPVVDGRLGLSRWQNIFFCEFDGPRSDRRVLCTLIADRD